MELKRHRELSKYANQQNAVEYDCCKSEKLRFNKKYLLYFSATQHGLDVKYLKQAMIYVQLRMASKEKAQILG